MEFSIGRHKIGNHHPVFVIAELSANHRQKFSIAVKTIEAAKKAGADAVKLQTFTPDTITLNTDNQLFTIRQNTVWDGRSLYKLYQEAYTPWEWQPKLKRIANKLGMELFSSPFDRSAVDFLKKMNVPAYKIASFEITDIPLITYTARQKKPVILSTGIARKQDIIDAVHACRKAGNNQIAVLKCTSSYPAPLQEMNLNTIADMGRRFRVIPGLSDHSLGIEAPVAAITLGAKIIEKHLILDKHLGGPDASFSLNPSEFKQMTAAIRNTEQLLGTVTYDLTAKGKKNREFSRSLFVAEDIDAGEKFTYENIRSVRPGFGLPPKFLGRILGRRSNSNLAKGTPMRFKYIKK